jgi:HEAT repeat protein
MKNKEKILKQKAILPRWLCSYLIFYLIINMNSYAENISNNPEILIGRLQEAINKGDANEVEINIKSLEQCGAEAIPAMQLALKSKDPQLRIALTRILVTIPKNESTSQLLELALLDKDEKIAKTALNGIENRTICRTLSKEEINIILSRIENDNVINAGVYARLLSKCISISTFDRAIPIIMRFKSEITTPTQVNYIYGTYVSGRAYALNQFIIAISNLGESVIPILHLLKKESQETKQESLKKWITIAMGTAGDETVSEDLRQLVEKEKDISLRALALRAYARSAKESAIPLLNSFIEDETSVGYADSHGKIFPLQIIARDEIKRLESKKKNDK